MSDAAYIKTEKISNAAKAREDMNPNQIAFWKVSLLGFHDRWHVNGLENMSKRLMYMANYNSIGCNETLTFDLFKACFWHFKAIYLVASTANMSALEWKNLFWSWEKGLEPRSSQINDTAITACALYYNFFHLDLKFLKTTTTYFKLCLQFIVLGDKSF